MKKIIFWLLVSALAIFDASAQTVAVGKYKTQETFEIAFLANLRTIPVSEFTIKSSDKEQGTIQAVQIDKMGRHEYASLFVLVTKETDYVLIEATFTRNAGFVGGGKPADWAKKYGNELKSELPDLTFDAGVENGKKSGLNKATVVVAPAVHSDNIGNPEVLTNDSIVKLVKAGMSEEIVVNIVKTQPTRFNLTVDELLALKTNGVSDKIINEMVLRGQGIIVTSVTSASGPTTPTTDATNNMSDPEVEQLCASLESDNPNEVGHALKVLRTMNASQAVPKILPCLTSSNPNTIRDACRTLAVLGNKDVILSIEPLLKHKRADVRKDAQDAIDKLQSK
jgi:HEAT repeats